MQLSTRESGIPAPAQGERYTPSYALRCCRRLGVGIEFSTGPSGARRGMARARRGLWPEDLDAGAREAIVREAAQFAFWSRGLSRTRGRTGVLLFLAVAERHAEIVADEGILARIAPEAWSGVLRDLMAALARGEAEAGLIRAVERIGAALAAEFPAAPGDTDELPNRVIVAE